MEVIATFGILRPLQVRRSGRAVPLGGPRQRAVLALLLEANRAVSMNPQRCACRHPKSTQSYRHFGR